MPPLTGGGKHHYGGVQEKDYGGGALIQRTTSGSVDMRRVRRAAGSWLPVKSYDDSTWEGGGATTPVVHPGRGKGPPGIPDVLSGKGGITYMPRGGVPRETGDEDGNAGALCAPACPRHRGDAGGRKPPPPRCARCDMQVPRRALNRRHPGNAQCLKGAERKRRRLAETETRENSERAFEAYGAPINSVSEFKYLGIILTATDDDWPAVVGNLRKARRSWRRLSRVISREGAGPKVSRVFYIAVTQAVFLFGSETWVLTARMEKALDSFQSRVARKITGRQPRQRKDRNLFYPQLAGVMKETGMVGIQTSILRRQNTVAQFIATRPILDLCEQATRRPGPQVSRRWWEKTGIDLKGAREKAAAAAAEPETEAVSNLE